MNSKTSLWRLYGPATVLSMALIIFVGVRSGASDLIKVVILAGLEISFSFDNAVVNAKILQRMSPLWQQLFMTLGIAIAVFGVRVLLPIILVALTAGLGLGTVVDQALHHADQYAAHLASAHPMIDAFGGMFLLLIFLDFMLQDRDIKWLKKLETALARIGRLRYVGVVTAISVLLFFVLGFTPGAEQKSVLIAGFIGLLLYLAISGLDSLVSVQKLERTTLTSTHALKAGIIGFLYLELIDASFSLDGVIGAFAITTKILLIMAGLGIGALYVRALTVHMLRRGTLKQYHYMEHGAHYAIGILAVLMLVSIRFEVPELVTGLSGIALIGAAIIHSRIENGQS